MKKLLLLIFGLFTLITTAQTGPGNTSDDSPCSTGTIVWTGNVNGDWHLPENWNPERVPNPRDIVVIYPTFEGDDVITISENISVYSITICGGIVLNVLPGVIVETTSNLSLNTFKVTDVVVLKNLSNIEIKTPSEIKSINIFDLQGRLVASKENLNTNLVTFTNINLPRQILLVQVFDKYGNSVTKKLSF